jgi:RimK family alpha-L-glutamate ligase
MPHLPNRLAARLPPRRLALVVDRIDWHARQLMQALAALGLTAVPVRLETCALTTQGRNGIDLTGFGARLPEAVLVRSLAGGTFQAVTLRLGILHALRESDVPVINDARAIERCVDKSMTSFLLARAGISTPATWAMESHEAARALVQAEAADGPLVLKPLFGSQGRGLKLILTPDDLPAPAAISGVYYLQRFVGVERDGFRDFRVLVSRGKMIGAMARHATQWITNIKQGARPLPAVIDPEVRQLALAAAEAVGAQFAGIDIVYTAAGSPTVLEVNSMPAWAGLQQVMRANIAALLAADLVALLSRGVARA